MILFSVPLGPMGFVVRDKAGLFLSKPVFWGKEDMS